MDYRLDGTANIILRYKGAWRPEHSLTFVDGSGRTLLLLACRFRQVRGRKITEVFLNAADAEGRWGQELSCEVAEEALLQGVELRFRSWRAEVWLGGRMQMACNPTASFGRGTDPAQAVALRTDSKTGTISLQTGVTQSCPAPEGDQDITLVLLQSEAPDALRARLADLAYLFREIIIIDPSPVLAATKDRVSARLTEEKIAAAFAGIKTSYVAVLSGPVGIQGLGDAVMHYLSTARSNMVMSLGLNPVMRLGEAWGVVLPAQAAGRPSMMLRSGICVIEPALTSLAYWQVARGSAAPTALQHLQQSSTMLPLQFNPEGRVLAAGHRQVPQVYVRVPHGPAPEQDFCGLQMDLRGLHGPLTPRKLLVPLCQAVQEGCASLFMIWSPEFGTAERAAAWLRLTMLSEVSVALDEGQRPVAIMLTRDLLESAFWVELDTLDSEALNRPCADFPEAVAALAELITRLEILVVRTALSDIDGQPAAELAPRHQWVSGSDLVWARLMAPPAVPVGRAKPAQIAQAQQDFDALMLQAMAHGMVWEMCQHAIAADLLQPKANFIPRLVGLFKTTGFADDLRQLATFMEALVARNYHNELRPLADKLIPHSQDILVQPGLVLRHRVLDVMLRSREATDTTYLAPEKLTLPVAVAKTLEPATVGYFIDSVTFYMALRRAWQEIVDLADGQDLPEVLSHGLYERLLFARIATGEDEGIEAMLQTLQQSGRLSAWSMHRLKMRLAHAQNDPDAIAAAIQELLQNESDMKSLLQKPTEFSQIACIDLQQAAAPPPPAAITVAPDEIACIIVARNEFFRLKWLHSYYRSLGVDRFFLIDNGSDDETIAYFALQPDVTLLQTTENYRDSRYGVKWHNEVAEAYLEDRWVLTVDADEALVFEGADQPGALRDLCARLDAEGSEGFFAPMIDMYSQERLDQTEYLPGESLIERFPMFDGYGYRFDPTPGFPSTTVSGGVRIRMFWNNRHEANVPHLAMQKVPLVRWKRGFRYLSSTHDMTPLKISEETGALLHFKFMPDFHRRAMEEVRRNQHYEGAREYQIYADFLKDPENRSFTFEGSARYEGPQSFADLGLIVPPTDPINTKASALWLQNRAEIAEIDAAGKIIAIVAEGTAESFAPQDVAATLNKRKRLATVMPPTPMRVAHAPDVPMPAAPVAAAAQAADTPAVPMPAAPVSDAPVSDSLAQAGSSESAAAVSRGGEVAD